MLRFSLRWSFSHGTRSAVFQSWPMGRYRGQRAAGTLGFAWSTARWGGVSGRRGSFAQQAARWGTASSRRPGPEPGRLHGRTSQAIGPCFERTPGVYTELTSRRASCRRLTREGMAWQNSLALQPVNSVSVSCACPSARTAHSTWTRSRPWSTTSWRRGSRTSTQRTCTTTAPLSARSKSRWSTGILVRASSWQRRCAPGSRLRTRRPQSSSSTRASSARGRGTSTSTCSTRCRRQLPEVRRVRPLGFRSQAQGRGPHPPYRVLVPCGPGAARRASVRPPRG